MGSPFEVLNFYIIFNEKVVFKKDFLLYKYGAANKIYKNHVKEYSSKTITKNKVSKQL